MTSPKLPIKEKWLSLIKKEFEKEYFLSLKKFLKTEYEEYICFPPSVDIFNVFRITEPDNIKAVILGQDPYHGDNQAMGLSFSVNKDVPVPPSLKNIYKELNFDLGIDIPKHGSLVSWAEQGVLLLNTCMTVRKGSAGSHARMGWETFTDKIIDFVATSGNPKSFILWGQHAISKANIISPNNLILKSPHPSPLSAHMGFFGSKPFSRTNQFLDGNNITSINWNSLNEDKI